MKTTKLISVLLALSLPLTNALAFNYTVSFTGSGASTTVNSVTVQNLTKGTEVTVSGGSTLTLTDVATSIQNAGSASDFLRVHANAKEGIFCLSFDAVQAGVYQISVFTTDGRKTASLAPKLNAGNNSVQITLPQGIFIVKISGAGCNLSKMMISNSAAHIQPAIQSESTGNSTAAKAGQKVKAADNAVSMDYSVGDRLLYKGVSGDYATIVTDVPTGNKTINFNFVECKDQDGNNYPVVTIGTQTWMAENLKTTKYKDGTSIPNVTDIMTWYTTTDGAYCSNSTYGALYNWYAVNTGNLAPAGWHVPTDAEWTTLSASLGGGDAVSVGKLKSTTGWGAPNSYGTNSSGFSALPGGYRNTNGSINMIGLAGYWWSSTDNYGAGAYYRVLHYDNDPDNTPFQDYNDYFYGYSVRCVKD